MSNTAKKVRNVATLSGGALVVASPFLSAGSASAVGQVFTVTSLADDGTGGVTLREAIESANADATADTIQFQAGLNGTITLASQLMVTESVDIQGPGAGVVTIDGDDKDRVLYVYNGSNLISVSVSGLTITGGYDSANAGGITSWDEEIELDSVVITGNTGDYAGGIYFRGGGASLTIRNSTISGNEGLSFGGGAYITSAGTDGYTGLVIENSTISGNTSGAYGGAFYFAHSDGDSIIRNSTISGNSALYDGGGVYVSHTVTGSVSIENSTITGNSADHGGGVFIVDSSATPVSIVNSVIAGNTATAVTDSDSGAGNDISSSNAEPISIDYSLIGDTVGYTADAGTGNLSGDPKLGALADNGGATKTHLPLAGSPVIDAGDPTFETPPSTDQRGLTRVVNSRIDMGAVEVQAPLPVLPPTGGSNGLMATLGAGLLALGGALHLTGRRKRTA